MSIDIFATRTMLAALEQIPAPTTFLLDTYFKGSKQFESEYVDMDIIKGKRRMAPFVHPTMEGKLVERIGFETMTYRAPYIKPKMASSAADLLQRSAGSNIYGSESLATRAARLMGDDLAELQRQITFREEWMAAQALDAGGYTATGDGISLAVDFGMAADHKITLTGNALWSATSTANPVDDLVDWCEKIAKESGLMPDKVIMGASAWKYFRNFYQAAGKASPLSPIKITLGEIAPKNLPGGVSYMGSVVERGVNLDIYTYAGYYNADGTGVVTPYVPDKKVWVGCTSALGLKMYGAIQDIEAGGSYAVARYPKSWTTPDPSVRFVMLQSASLVAMLQPDAFISATVLS